MISLYTERLFYSNSQNSSIYLYHEWGLCVWWEGEAGGEKIKEEALMILTRDGSVSFGPSIAGVPSKAMGLHSLILIFLCFRNVTIV